MPVVGGQGKPCRSVSNAVQRGKCDVGGSLPSIVFVGQAYTLWFVLVLVDFGILLYGVFGSLSPFNFSPKHGELSVKIF